MVRDTTWDDIRIPPKNYDLDYFIKLAFITDYLSGEYKSFSQIFNMVLKKKLVLKKDRESFFRAFKRTIRRINLIKFDFDAENNYYRYKLISGITNVDFYRKVEEYRRKHYKGTKSSLPSKQTTLF